MDKRSALFGAWAAALLWAGNVNAQNEPKAADIAVETIELPFATTLLKLDPTGKRALVAGVVVEDLPAQLRPGEAPKTELALIDLETRKILVRTQIDGRLKLVHLDDRAAYIVPQEGSPLHVLSLDTLQQTRRIFMNPPVNGLSTLPGGKLAVQTDGGLKGYSNETFEAAALPGCSGTAWNGQFAYLGGDFAGSHDPEAWAPAIELNDGILFNGAVLDKAGRPQFLYHCPRLQSFGAGNRFSIEGQDMFEPNQRAAYPRRWGREIARSRLTGSAAGAVASLPGAAVILRDYPLAAAVAVQFTSGRGSNKLSLTFHDLVESKLLDEVTLGENAFKPKRQQAARGLVTFLPIVRDGGDRVVVAYDAILYLASLDRERFKATAEPVHFIYREQPFWAPAGKVASVAFEAKGGVGKKKYRLVSPVKGLSIGLQSGNLQVDTAAIWKRYLQLYQPGGDWPPPEPGVSEPGSSEPDPRERSRKVVEQLLGRAVEEVPVAVGFRLSAVDAEGQEDQATALFIVLGPKQEFENQLAQAKVDQEKALEEAHKAQQAAEQRNAMAAQSRNDATSEQRDAAVAATVARLDELTQQNEGLAAGIEDLRVALAESKKQSEHLAQQASEDRKQRTALGERLDALVRQSQDQQRYLWYLLVAAGALAFLLVVVLGSRVASRRASAAGG